ncbi:MAG TPA: Crp/Fnr family transcriptional regulator [Vicinamibacterales bacterium]|nr:Crp/Fnr family transcriptional regulator [Vicinamibacterales bacterium]
MSAFDPLRRYLERRSRPPYSAKELDFLETLFVPRTLRRGEFLQRAGEPVPYAAFVAAGCLRSYVIDAKGEEVILQFAPPDWWLGDSAFLTGGTTCESYIDAITDAELLAFDQKGFQKMMDGGPHFAANFRIAFQKAAAAKDRRIVDALSLPVEERYLDFVKTYPAIANQVPQRMIASYLGTSPETLSRIRKQLSRK